MKILYDGQIYNIQAMGGISRYFANLITHLPPDFHPTILVTRPDTSGHPTHGKLRICQYQATRLRHISHRLDAFYLETFKNYKNVDVVHPTYYTLCTGQDISKIRAPMVLTVWDLTHEIFAPTLDPTGQHAEVKRRAILSAQAILCISQNTKQDLLERYDISPAKITVTHLAANIDATLSHGDEEIPDEPYYLYVGSREAYKNFDGLLRAFAKVASVKTEVILCAVGLPFDATEKQMITQLNLDGRVKNFGQVSDTHLAKLYRCSNAFVYPSFYEGFGIPLLEAMSCGTAVVASNTSSFPEVVGDAGILFDPRSDDDLADILLTLCDSPSERERLIKKGHERAKEFSWAKTVSQTLEVYRLVGA